MRTFLALSIGSALLLSACAAPTGDVLDGTGDEDTFSSPYTDDFDLETGTGTQTGTELPLF